MDTVDDDDLTDWEEWDGKGIFWHHCVAGSIAGVSEHALMFPFDTVKTHMMACRKCPHSYLSGKTSSASHKLSSTNMSSPPGMWTTMRGIMSDAAATSSAELTSTTTTTAGMTRLWRGVYTIVVGCIPAHALYFSTYEAMKHASIDSNSGTLSNTGAMMAGAAAAMSHDCIMTPLDTIKQRLQLGHYRGMMHALTSMARVEGLASLYRSFPITLLTNIPHGMVMVSTNEFLKHKLMEYSEKESLDVSTCLVASSVAGMTAAATTTPLDRLKTFLQTQQLQPTCKRGECPRIVGTPIQSPVKAFSIIINQEGFGGLFRGMVPRVISQTPAVAISWTTYETAKQYLAQNYS